MSSANAGQPTLAELCARLREMGINVIDFTGEFMTPEGPLRVLSAYNPQNGETIILPIVPDNTRISRWLIGNIHRRLRIVTGFPWA